MARSFLKNDQLIKLWRKGDYWDIVEHYRPIAAKTARDYFWKVRYPTHADLIQEGLLTLYKKLHNFKERCDTTFDAFACIHIRYGMKRAVIAHNDMVRKTAAYKKIEGQLRRAHERLVAQGIEPTPQALFAEAGFKRVNESRRLALQTYNQANTVFEIKEDDSYYTVNYYKGESLARKVRRCIGELDPRSREMVARKFGLYDGKPATYEEIGADFNLSKSYCKAIVLKALASIKSKVS